MSENPNKTPGAQQLAQFHEPALLPGCPCSRSQLCFQPVQQYQGHGLAGTASVSIKPWGLSWSREAPRVQLGWNTMFKTILWDPAGASALVQRQPDGNEVERAVQRWGMGNPFPLQGGQNNSDSEIHIHMYQQGSVRALMGMLAASSCQRDVTCALCGIEETGQRRHGESLCHCTRAGWAPQNQSRICSSPLSFSSPHELSWCVQLDVPGVGLLFKKYQMCTF